MKKKYSKKRGPVRAKKVSFDGIQFASGLELYMYKALKEANIVGEYEPTSYVLLKGFDYGGICFEKQANGKGDYKDRGCKKILPIKYKPDFSKISAGLLFEKKFISPIIKVRSWK